MKKTSVYLSEEERRALREAADAHGLSQAQIIRKAITLFTEQRRGPRQLSLAGSGSWEGRSVSEMTPEEFDELMEAFGEDSWSSC